MPRELLNERSIQDLDLDMYSDDAKEFIRKIFPKIRSYHLKRGKFHQTLNICTLNNNNKIEEQVRTFLKKISCFTKVQITRGHIVLQENKQLRYLCPHEDNHGLLSEAFTIKNDGDVEKFIELLNEKNEFDLENFNLKTSSSKHVAVTQFTVYTYPIAARLLLNGSPIPEIPRKWKKIQVFVL